jgi:hypothetical protein
MSSRLPTHPDQLPAELAARLLPDLPLLQAYPASLGSLLFAHTVDDPQWAAARDRWRVQLAGQAWVETLWRLPEGQDTQPHLPVVFSPDGRRMTRGDGLFDAETQTRLATVDAARVLFPQGAAARPSFHLGNRYLINVNGPPQMWSTETGARVPVGLPPFARPCDLAFNDAGDRVVAIPRGHPQHVPLYRLPDGVLLRRLRHVPPVGVTPLRLTPGGLQPRPRNSSLPPGWSLARIEGATVFTHRATGTSLALPAVGRWRSRPTHRTLLASSTWLVHLHEP